MSEQDPVQREHYEGRFIIGLAILAAALCVLPNLYALLISLAGFQYTGYQYNMDDQMVYAAWMRQAMDGHLLFDNRFAVDVQPGLTINLYFLLLGFVAKLTGIPLATTLARMGFSALFVFLLARLLRKITRDVFTTKLALSIVVFGGGVGYLVWQNFGVDISRPPSLVTNFFLLGHLPTDVWQPEGYVFPSMLTNSLFMVALCLILYIFNSFLEARDSTKPVLGGFLATFALMNVHSYDVLMIALVMAGFLAAALLRRQVTTAWLLRSLAIAAGAILPALWFLHVLRVDPVFQKRAETLTFAPNYRQVLIGYLPMVALAFIAFARWKNGTAEVPKSRVVGAAILGALILIGFALASGHQPNSYWMGLPEWLALLALAIACVCLLSTEEPVWNLLLAWAVIGMISPYFPALFERKLAMGLAIPWASLAALGLGGLIADRERGSRNLATLLGFLVLCGNSLLWTIRETSFARNDVSNTTVHPVYLSSDAERILDYLRDHRGTHTIVVAMPGVPAPDDQRADSFRTPYMPDLNPFLSGFAGVYAFAGHWSETPDYGRRRSMATSLFLTSTPQDKRAGILATIQPNYIVAPVPEAFTQLPIAELDGLGDVVVDGSQFRLIHLR